jgi:uncharacterized C2H2 Zn-finger protein
MASVEDAGCNDEDIDHHPTPTFPCPSCDKTYLTQHSLTRHSHNHKKTSEHNCPSCKVVFYRKDLLVRHMKMHDTTQSGNRGGRRIRCHTACTNCRDARIKCDSYKPCASCVAFGKQCTYSTKSARVSTNTRAVEANEDNNVSGLTSKLPLHSFNPALPPCRMRLSSSEQPTFL